MQLQEEHYSDSDRDSVVSEADTEPPSDIRRFWENFQRRIINMMLPRSRILERLREPLNGSRQQQG